MSASAVTPRANGGRPLLRLKAIWWAIGWSMVLFITYGCLSPPRYVPNLHLWDKLEHALAFFGLTFWFCGLVRSRSYPIVAFAMLLFGIGIEFAQGWMALGRDEDFRDWVADSVGVLGALALLYFGIGLGISSWLVRLEQLLGLSREPA